MEVSVEPGHFEGADGEPRRKLHRPHHSRIQEALEKALEGAAIYTGSRTDYVTQLTTLVYENGCTMENHLEKACRKAGLRCLSRHKKFWGEYAQSLLLEFRADVQEWSWLECLDYWEQCTPLHKRVKFATISESKEVIKMIFERNGYDLAHELAILAQIIDREVDKANVLHIIGSPHAGKTLVLVSVARSLNYLEANGASEAFWLACISSSALDPVTQLPALLSAVTEDLERQLSGLATNQQTILRQAIASLISLGCIWFLGLLEGTIVCRKTFEQWLKLPNDSTNLVSSDGETSEKDIEGSSSKESAPPPKKPRASLKRKSPAIAEFLRPSKTVGKRGGAKPTHHLLS